MRHIHPFPARMAPEIVLSKLSKLPKGYTVLDPMSGSGMVLSQASKSGLHAIGYDLDPLARMISRAGSTRVSEKKAEEALEKLIFASKKLLGRRKDIILDWIDDDKETSDFVDFWFYSKQIKQLRALSYCLVTQPIINNKKILEILKVSLSRLIITKEPKASLARDAAHSRPHKTISKNDFDIFHELPVSLKHVLKSLDSPSIQFDAKTYLGDARQMTRVGNESIDAIITSPPYLNAIDYMRGHRLSLVWLGYRLGELRNIRSKSIGTERTVIGSDDSIFNETVKELGLKKLDSKNLNMLNRYFYDLLLQLNESYRVLKKGGSATYVIGNSTIRGKYISNSELLKKAGKLAGFKVCNESIREIPDNRRYLPVVTKSKNSLASRMRTEHVIEFVKTVRRSPKLGRSR
ncbi:MAG: hypothetical protein GC149_07735 [Gammaproteobacteria bacterium]|nr:hypothetical protein [Gammaproteobacteria bacterium]